MPPKTIYKWDVGKLMIKSVNGEWVEAAKINENPILEPISAPCETFEVAPITSFSVSFQAEFKHRKRLFQELGLWKRPKLTYKTNRHYKRPKHHRKH